MRNISSFNLDHLPEESLCIQSGIHCIYLLWRSRDRCSSLCLRCTAGSLNRSHCSHTPTYKHTKNPNFIQTWKHQRKTLYVVTVYNANLYLSATMLSQFCVPAKWAWQLYMYAWVERRTSTCYSAFSGTFLHTKNHYYCIMPCTPNRCCN